MSWSSVTVARSPEAGPDSAERLQSSVSPVVQPRQKASGLYTERTISDQRDQMRQIAGIQHELGDSGNLFRFRAADLDSGPRSGQTRTTTESNQFESNKLEKLPGFHKEFGNV